MKSFIILFCLLSVIIPRLSFSQPAGRGILTRQVTDEKGNPLPGAPVFFHDVKAGAITDASGKYKTAPITWAGILRLN